MIHAPSRRHVIAAGAGAVAASALPSLAPLAFAAQGAGRYGGINVAGAEFGKVPGKFGTDYAYPSPKTVQFFADQGFNLIRLPFRWERLQPELGQPLDVAELGRLKATVEFATRLKLAVALDTHNYAKRRLPSDGWANAHLIGSEAVPTASFVDFCGRLATEFKDNPSVMFGIMNEPTSIKAPEWLPIVNAALVATRQAGATQLALVPGVNYTGAHSWARSGNEIMSDAVDPGNNMAIEVHQYLDDDSSGTKPESVSRSVGTDRIQAFQDWARKKGVKAFLGEFGAGPDEQSLAALDGLCAMMRDNADVWMGWAAWTGGDWWPADYPFNVTPAKNGTVRPQLAVLASHAKQLVGTERRDRPSNG